MAKNLSDFANEKIDIKKMEEEVIKNTDKLQRETVETAEEVYNKYKDMSQEDLTKEFLSASKQKLQNGELTHEKLANMAGLLSPYLNNNQKAFLNDLLKNLDE